MRNCVLRANLAVCALDGEFSTPLVAEVLSRRTDGFSLSGVYLGRLGRTVVLVGPAIGMWGNHSTLAHVFIPSESMLVVVPRTILVFVAIELLLRSGPP